MALIPMPISEVLSRTVPRGCGETTWTGCGAHIDAVTAPHQWCLDMPPPVPTGRHNVPATVIASAIPGNATAARASLDLLPVKSAAGPRVDPRRARRCGYRFRKLYRCGSTASSIRGSRPRSTAFGRYFSQSIRANRTTAARSAI